MDQHNPDSKTPVFLHDSYIAWCNEQTIPVIEDFGIDMMKIETQPWDLFGMNGAACLMKGRDDFVSIFCFELPAGSKSRPLHHLYEEIIFVMDGYGSTQIETPSGKSSHSNGDAILYSPCL